MASLATSSLPLPREQHERELGKRLADALQEFDPVGPGHVVVRDDAVDRPLCQRVESVVGVRGRGYLEAVVLPFEELRHEVGEIGLVVDV